MKFINPACSPLQATVPLNLSQIMPYKYLYTFSMITSLRLACPSRFILFQNYRRPSFHYPVDFPLTGSLTWVGSCVYVYIGISLNHNILHTILGIAAGPPDKGVHSSEILRSLWTKHFVHVAKFLSQRVPYNEQFWDEIFLCRLFKTVGWRNASARTVI